MENMKGKTAFITGGASGLGLAIAKACAAEGMNVVIADLRQPVLDQAVSEFEKNGWPVLGLQLDTSSLAQYEKAVKAAEDRFGNIHLLINNAGITCTAGPLHEVSFRDIEIGLDVNLWGVINGIKLILPHMLEHGEEAHIVSTASMSGLLPTAKCDIYNITKSAVVALTESLAASLIGSNVGMSVFCPGPHDTELGANSEEVQAELAGEKLEKPAPTESNTLPAYDNSVTRSPAEAGRRVIRGIKRGDLYILTHSEFKPGLAERWDAIMRAIPDEEPDERFFKEFAFLATNPVFNYQQQVPALEK